MANKATMITELVNDWRVYREGKDVFVGATSIEVAGLQSATADVVGIGLAGKIEAPVEGHFEPIEVKINYRTPIPEAFTIVGGQPISLEIYGDIQHFDPAASEHYHQQLKVTVRGRGKNYEMGSIEAMATTDSSTTIETHYLKYEIDGKEVLLIDKFNYVFRVNGRDFLTDVRRVIGI